MRLYSVLTNDFKHCYITGNMPVAIHHIFGAANRKNSEKYGFIVPLHPDYHTGKFGIHNGNRKLDLQLKCACEKWWLESGHTKEEWHSIFGKWFTEESEKEVPQIF